MELCPSCQNVSTHSIAADFSDEYGLVFRECKLCHSQYSDPLVTIDYTDHLKEVDIACYVECNCNVFDIILRLHCATEGKRDLRVLDVGAGVGYGISFLKEMQNCDVVGFEPSRYGQIGNDELDLNVKKAYFNQMSSLDLGTFDLVNCSEVIEHVIDQNEFIKFLGSVLKPNGKLVLTTPDPSQIPQTRSPVYFAMYSPRHHTILLSENGLKSLVKQAGLEVISVKTSNRSLELVACKPGTTKSAFSVTEATFDSLLSQYIDYFLTNVKNPSLITGIVHRSFTFALAKLDLPLLDKLLPYIEDILDRHRLTITGFKNVTEYYEFYPIPFGQILYNYGMYCLNQKRQPEIAFDYFVRAILICEDFVRHTPSEAIEQKHLRQPALFHASLSAKQAGLINKSNIYRQMLISEPDLSVEWAQRINEL